MLRAQIGQALLSGYSASTARLVPVDSIIHETFACSECGLGFSTAAALKRHVYLQHMEDEQQLTRRQEVEEQSLHSHMEHARQGLPWCRHCDKRFNNWPNFHYHINARCCPILRAIYNQPQPGNTIMLLSEALIDNQDIVEIAGRANWLELAADPRFRHNLCHCVERHHKSVRPQYVKRHMLAKHPDLKPVIDKCQLFVQKSNVSIVSPCRFCGEAFHRRDAHLRSCVALFSGAYLFSRLGRALPAAQSVHHDSGARPPGTEPKGDRAAEAGGGHAGAPVARNTGSLGSHGLPFLPEPRGPGNGRGPAGPLPERGRSRRRSTTQVAKAGVQRAGRPRKRPESAPACQTLQQVLGKSARRQSEQVGSGGAMEHGGTPAPHAEGAAAVENKSRSADHPASSPRQPAGDPSTRHSLYVVHQDGCEGQLGGDVVPDGPQMEASQGAGSNQARIPDAGGADPGASNNGGFEVRAADVHPGDPGQCGPTGLAQRGGHADSQHEVGRRCQETRRQPDRQLARPPEGAEHARGADRSLQGRPSGQSLSCHAPHHPGDRFVGAPDDAGCGPSVPRGGQSMADTQGPVRVRDLASGGCEHETGSAPARTLGPEARLVDGEVPLMTRLMQMRLGNEGNYCYCNALVRCILILAAKTADPAGFFPRGLRSVFKGLLMF